MAASPASDVGPETAAAIHSAIDSSFVAGFRLLALLGAGLVLASGLWAAFVTDERTVPMAHRTGR